MVNTLAVYHRIRLQILAFETVRLDIRFDAQTHAP